MSRTKHHRDALTARRYMLLDRPPRRRSLRASWNLRTTVTDLVEILRLCPPIRALRASIP